MPVVSASQAATGARFWMRRAGYGVLLGAAIATLEFAYYFPLVSEHSRFGLNSYVSLLLVWGGECALLALTVAVAERGVRPRELRTWELGLAVALGAFGGSLIWQVLMDFVLRDRAGLVLYHGWLILFFGGLAAAVYSSQRRRARVLAALRAAELGRARSQQRLAEVTLGSLQSRIDPEFLFQTLTRLERLYEADPTGADRVLEELIVFLRRALAEIQASSAPARADRTPAHDARFQLQ